MVNQSSPEPKNNNFLRIPNQRWQIYPKKAELAQKFAENFHLSPIISQLVINRGMETDEDAEIFLNPESLILPSPLEEFPDLAMSVELLKNAIASQAKIAICGDYDADGMTSTALLLRCLRWLGAKVDYAIPSRMHEGYGINQRIIQEFHQEGVELILTVDNGISAYEPIALARQLGVKVIVTDHHDIPQQLPPADAILNPKLLPESSLYRGVAGVGVAYILAVCLAQQMEQSSNSIIKSMLELFTLGTIADLAPLSGVNRRWVKRGLQQLPKSKLPGVQALVQISGVQKKNSNGNGTLKPDDIGFRLGPRINAIGRIGDPQIVIELLTTDDMGIALEKAMQCEQTNTRRQDLCQEIERCAIAVVESQYLTSLHHDRVLVIIQPDWHHGVIGIVASRLVERYGVPVFIGTYEDDTHIRGSARGIPEFNVFEALDYCRDLLGKFGGHKAAGGFSLPVENLAAVQSRMREFANKYLEIHHLKPLLKIDAQVNLNEINQELYQQLNSLHPCGIDNPEPVFWTPDVYILEQQIVGKTHVKLTIAQTIDNQQYKIKAIAWRWSDYYPLPKKIDIAYKLRENHFNGNITIEMELVGVRLPCQHHLHFETSTTQQKVSFEYQKRHYTCGIYQNGALPELRIKNPEGKILAIQSGHTTGLLGQNRDDAKLIDISQPQYHNIIQAALQALGT